MTRRTNKRKVRHQSKRRLKKGDYDILKDERTLEVQPSNHKSNKVVIVARNENQKHYLKSINDNLITICTGPAGVGKTSLAVMTAYKMYVEKRVSRIIITRPIVEVQSISKKNEYGSLPGTLAQKIHPYLIPIYDEFLNMMNKSELDILIEKEVIEIVPLPFMRGRNFHNCFVVGDEFNNATKKELDCFITRIGDNCKMVLSGDITQCDLYRDFAGGLEEYTKALCGINGIGIINFTKADIVRNPIIGNILTQLEEYRNANPLQNISPKR